METLASEKAEPENTCTYATLKSHTSKLLRTLSVMLHITAGIRTQLQTQEVHRAVEAGCTVRQVKGGALETGFAGWINSIGAKRELGLKVNVLTTWQTQVHRSSHCNRW